MGQHQTLLEHPILELGENSWLSVADVALRQTLSRNAMGCLHCEERTARLCRPGMESAARWSLFTAQVS